MEPILRLTRSLGVRFGVSVVVWILMFALAYSFEGDAFDALTYAIGGPLLLGAIFYLWGKGVADAIDARAAKIDDPSGRKPGDWVVIAGKAVALAETMRATLGDREALACHYQVMERQESMRSNSSFLHKIYEGHHLVPTGIETTTGTIPLRALPNLTSLDESSIGHGESKLDSVAVPCSARKIGAALAKVAAQKQDRVDIDWKFKSAESDRRIIRKEWVLPPGEQICVFGRWDGEALIPSAMRPRGLPVYAGTVEQLRTELGGTSKVFFIISAIPLLILLWWTYSIAS